MRIIGGKYRRQGLFSNPGMTTRPITNRMKEYLFEEIRANVQGARVLDAFAGTGTIGLESLSRGADSIVFMEQDHKAFDLLKQNVAKLGVEKETFCWRTNVVRSSFLPKGHENFLPYDLIFFDPPYPMVPGLKDQDPLYKALVRLHKDQVSAENALLLFRAPQKTDFEIPDIWTVVDELSVASSTIFFYRKTASLEQPVEENSEASEA
ncbi:MAG: 16S rRNA (guanine(966)-N(2))-methyltransferase RsmD [Planctomycetaceae bacterium]|nr:16S rRNA (guanine(966)-N(2))-methyltransferase RsmD [Planctomycetaceae bacterium]